MQRLRYLPWHLSAMTALRVRIPHPDYIRCRRQKITVFEFLGMRLDAFRHLLAPEARDHLPDLRETAVHQVIRFPAATAKFAWASTLNVLLKDGRCRMGMELAPELLVLLGEIPQEAATDPEKLMKALLYFRGQSQELKKRR